MSSLVLFKSYPKYEDSSTSWLKIFSWIIEKTWRSAEILHAILSSTKYDKTKLPPEKISVQFDVLSGQSNNGRPCPQMSLC